MIQSWKSQALFAGAFGFVTAILLALTGLPEVEQDEEK